MCMPKKLANKFYSRTFYVTLGYFSWERMTRTYKLEYKLAKLGTYKQILHWCG